MNKHYTLVFKDHIYFEGLSQTLEVSLTLTALGINSSQVVL